MSELKINVGWKFDNSYARLPKLLFTLQSPVPVRLPKVVMLNKPLAASLGLDVHALQSNDSAEVFAGNRVPEGAMPIAQAYAGHQFGHFTMLGDGRAVLLGEQITPDSRRVDIQLKGSGRTPYSRGGDGRAVLGPMLREYIISEAMHALGIPTTRSLAVSTTGEKVIRESPLPGAVLTRIAASHLRVGTFQYVANWGTVEDLRALADYTLQRHFPDRDSGENRYLGLLQEMIQRQASLIAKWQLVGFIHGVMNTDNMAISGETIDYGPCAFMDTYDPATVFSSIDTRGRYAYGNQPHIALWNLTRFAEAILPLLHDDEEQSIQIAEDALSEYSGLYRLHWLAGMRAKLGIAKEEPEDEALIEDLLDLMQKQRADFTNTFRALTLNKLAELGEPAGQTLERSNEADEGPEQGGEAGESGDGSLFSTAEYKQWKQRWQMRLDRQQQCRDPAGRLMQNNNPAVIPRNHRVEEALEAAADREDYSVMERLLEALANPFAYAPEQIEYCALPSRSGAAYRTFCGT